MSKSELSPAETLELALHVANGMVGKTDFLTKADQKIGDGDHGIGMERGFSAVAEKLAGNSYDKADAVFKDVGMTMMTSVGGAAGAIFGTLFRGGSKGMGDSDTFTTAGLAALLTEGLAAIKKRGGASAGDKTMIDALEPAAEKATELKDKGLGEALVDVTEAARLGMEATKDMVATTGKAKTLGERSLGHSDPGSISMYLIIDFMREYAN